MLIHPTLVLLLLGTQIGAQQALYQHSKKKDLGSQNGAQPATYQHSRKKDLETEFRNSVESELQGEDGSVKNDLAKQFIQDHSIQSSGSSTSRVQSNHYAAVDFTLGFDSTDKSRDGVFTQDVGGRTEDDQPNKENVYHVIQSSDSSTSRVQSNHYAAVDFTLGFDSTDQSLDGVFTQDFGGRDGDVQLNKENIYSEQDSSLSSITDSSSTDSNVSEEVSATLGSCFTDPKRAYNQYLDNFKELFYGAFDDSQISNLTEEANQVAKDFSNIQIERARLIATLPTVNKTSVRRQIHSLRYYLDDTQASLQQIYSDSLVAFNTIYKLAIERAHLLVFDPYSKTPHTEYIDFIYKVEKMLDAHIREISFEHRRLVREVARWHQFSLLNYLGAKDPAILVDPRLPKVVADRCSDE
ncbi:hypothetical protein L0F63_000008 [Massospora cicadina]|nr:hypothetical protein L0F63_000008 [Massospora cicadina]